jgi:dolichyl-phosphate beta-glucosyltransferase
MTRSIIVVPCYNEAARLKPEAFEAFVGMHRDVNFLLVNDGSRDKTLEVLERLHERNPAGFSFLHLGRNCGKAEAVRQGVLRALEQAPDFVGYWDADLATPLEEIPRFKAVLDRHADVELVLGARLPLLGHRVERRPLRKLLGRCFATVAGTLLRLPIHDTQCGAKLFRVTPTVDSIFGEPFAARWVFDVEILARWRRMLAASSKESLDDVLFELPLECWTEMAGSKVRPHHFLTAFVELTGIYSRYLRPGATVYPSRQADVQPIAEPGSRKRKAA